MDSLPWLVDEEWQQYGGEKCNWYMCHVFANGHKFKATNSELMAPESDEDKNVEMLELTPMGTVTLLICPYFQ